MKNQSDTLNRQARNSCQVSQQPLIQRVAANDTLQRAYTWLQAQQPSALPHWDHLKSSLQVQDALTQSHLLLEQHQLGQALGQTVMGRASHGFEFLGYHLTPIQLTVSKPALKKRVHKSSVLTNSIKRLLGLSGALSITATLLFGQPALAAPFSYEYNDTIDSSRADSLPVLADGSAVKIIVTLDNDGTSRNSQTWTATHLVSVTWKACPLFATFFAPFGGALSGTDGDFTSDASGNLTAVMTGWYDDAPGPDVTINGTLSFEPSYVWYLNGFNGVFTLDGWDTSVNLTNVEDMLTASNWSVSTGSTSSCPSSVPPSTPTYTLIVTTAGTGTGTVTGAGSYPAGTAITLGATPDANSNFVGWSPNSCQTGMMLTADTTCVATFELKAPSTPPSPSTTPMPLEMGLFLQVDGSGQGRVTTNTGMFCQTNDCQADKKSGELLCKPEACSQVVKSLTTVTLNPIADAGSVFSSWGGHPHCVNGTFLMNTSRLCIAYFRKLQASLFLTMEGTGQGQVSVNVGKLDWTSNHEAHATYDVGTEVELVATALPGAYFVGFGGHDDCVDGKIKMTAERACVAHFNLNEEVSHNVPTEATPQPLPEPAVPVTTTPEVPTTPVVETTPGTLETVPVEEVPTTPVVETTPSTVEAVPEEVAAQAVVLPPATLTTVKLGPGNLHSDPAGIECGETCQAAYPLGTVVTLTAIPNNGAIFKEWSGDCNSPELATTMTITTDTHCQATFAEATTTTETTTVPEVIPPPALSTTPETAPLPEVTPQPVISPDVPVVPAMPVTTPTPVSTVQSPVTTIPTVVSSLVSQSCVTTGEINQMCNYGGRTVTALDVQGQGIISNGVLNSTLTNVGWVSNFTITAKGKLTGGVVTGYIINFGVILDFEFKGMSIIGGTLGGTILNTSKVGGYFQDVTLLPNTKITGGILKGKIKGDKKSPAVLEKVRVKKGSQLSGVKLGKYVTLEKGVIMEDKQ